MVEQIIEFSPAFDTEKRGIHGVTLRMYLKGELGAVQFVVYTNWHLPEVQERLEESSRKSLAVLFKPLPADVGYHSPKPMYEGQIPMEGACGYVGGGTCYYDGSGLHAAKIFEVLTREGHEGVWRDLKIYYCETFGEVR